MLYLGVVSIKIDINSLAMAAQCIYTLAAWDILCAECTSVREYRKPQTSIHHVHKI